MRMVLGRMGFEGNWKLDDNNLKEGESIHSRRILGEKMWNVAIAEQFGES